MKARVLLVGLVFIFIALPAVHAQEFGKIRALQQRAAHVTKLKNDYISKVLASYTIPHERGRQGIVTRIHVDGRWLEVTAVEIVPVLAGASKRVTAHELFFYTRDGILDLTSELLIR